MAEGYSKVLAGEFGRKDNGAVTVHFYLFRSLSTYAVLLPVQLVPENEAFTFKGLYEIRKEFLEQLTRFQDLLWKELLLCTSTEEHRVPTANMLVVPALNEEIDYELLERAFLPLSDYQSDAVDKADLVLQARGKPRK